MLIGFGHGMLIRDLALVSLASFACSSRSMVGQNLNPRTSQDRWPPNRFQCSLCFVCECVNEIEHRVCSSQAFTLQAQDTYNAFLGTLRKEYIPERVQDGIFGAIMDVSLVNDGPVTCGRSLLT